MCRRKKCGGLGTALTGASADWDRKNFFCEAQKRRADLNKRGGCGLDLVSGRDVFGFDSPAGGLW